MNRNVRGLCALVCLCFTSFGFSMTIIGAVLPGILQSFHWSDIAAGVVFGAGAVAYFISTFLSGMLSHLIGLRVLLSGGLALMAVPMFLFGTLPSFLFHVLLNGMIGFGQGVLEFASNVTISSLEKRGQNKLMSLLHASFAFGAVAGPLIAGLVLAGKGGWLFSFRLIGTFIAALFVVTLFVPSAFFAGKSDEAGAGVKVRFRELRSLLLVLSVSVILLYVGVEIGISNWIAEFFVRIKGGSKVHASMMVAVFWTGLLCGRLVFPLLAKTVNLKLQLLVSGIFIVVSVVLIGVIKDGLFFSAAVLLSGLACSLVYPLIMSIVGQYYRGKRNRPIAALTTAGGIGAFAFPFAMAAISGPGGLTASFVFLGAVAVLLTLAAGILWKAVPAGTEGE